MSGQNPYALPGKNWQKYGRVIPPRARSQVIDVHEILKADMASQGEGSVGGGENFRSPFVPPIYDVSVQDAIAVSAAIGAEQQNQQQQQVAAAKIPTPISSSVPTSLGGQIGVTDVVIEFDSLNTTSTNEASGIINFSAITINKQQPIQNIIEMEIGSFYFPDIAVASYQPSFYYYRRVAMTIEQLKAPGTQINSSNVDHHFMFQANLAGVSRELIPIENRFVFKQPINSIEDLSFRFTAAGKPITLPTLTYSVQSVAGSAPGRFTFPTAHGLDSAVTHAIYFSGFATPDAALNAIVNDINGHMVTVIDAVTVELDAATATVFPGIVYGATAVVAERRIMFQLRFRSIEQKITQYIIPV